MTSNFPPSSANVIPTGDINRLVNGGFALNPEGTVSRSDTQICFVNWKVLTQSGAVQTSQLVAPEAGQAFAARITQSQATAQRFGVAQTVLSANCYDLRTAFLSLFGRIRFSTAGNIRFAILQWDGTADAAPSDVVNDWTSSSYTAGQFFVSSVSVLNVGNFSGAASVWASVPYIPIQCGASLTNLILFVWTQDNAAQNVTLDLGSCQIAEGPSNPAFGYLSYGLQQAEAGIGDGDNITVTATGSVTARTLADRFVEVMSAEDFGAIGDGVTDNAIAFSAASTWANAIPGRCIELLPGNTYLTTAQVAMHQSIWRSFGAATIKFSGLGSSTDCVVIQGSTCQYPAGLEGISINCNAVGRDGVLFAGGKTGSANADFPFFKRGLITGAVRDGIHMQPQANSYWIENPRLQDVRIFNPGRHGIALICPNLTSVFINKGVGDNVEVRGAGQTTAGYDIYCDSQGATNQKISEWVWINPELDMAGAANHGVHSVYFDMTGSVSGYDNWAFVEATFEDTSSGVGKSDAIGVAAGANVRGIFVHAEIAGNYPTVIDETLLGGNAIVVTPNSGTSFIRLNESGGDSMVLKNNTITWRASGGSIDTILSRSSGGLNVNNAFNVNKGSSAPSSLTIGGANSQSAIISLIANAGSGRFLTAYSGSFIPAHLRGALRLANQDAEAGANAGSNPQWESYDDTGNLIGNYVSFTRSTLAALFGGLLSSVGSMRALSATAIPAGGTTGAGVMVSSASNFGVFFGSGAPTLSAAKGSLYLRSDGSTTNDRAYINTNGSTTWTALTTVA